MESHEKYPNELQNQLYLCITDMSNQNMREEQDFVSSLLTCVVTYFNQKMGVSLETKIPIAEPDFGILEPEDGEILLDLVNIKTEPSKGQDEQEQENKDETEIIKQPLQANCDMKSKSHSKDIAKKEENIAHKEKSEDSIDFKSEIEKDSEHSETPRIKSEDIQKSVTISKDGKRVTYHSKKSGRKITITGTDLTCKYCSFSVESDILLGKYATQKLKRHNKVRHNVCEICREKCDDKKQLNNHMFTVHTGKNGSLVCGVDGCTVSRDENGKYSKLGRILAHVRLQHDKVRYICEECNEPYLKYSQHIRQHNQPMQQNVSLNCNDCDLICQNHTELKLHIKAVHVIQFKCDSCDYQTPIPTSLTMHKREHNGGIMKCEYCDHQSRQPESFRHHVNNKHLLPKLHCTFCGYKTTGNSRLNNHVARHTRENVFRCDRCDYKAYVNEDLKKHIRQMHEGSQKYLCDECDYKTSDCGNFGTHKKVKHGSVFLKCDSCDYQTRSARSLREHSCQNGTQIKCEKCGFETKSSRKLKKHNNKIHHINVK